MFSLKELNPEQRKAVEAIEGPVLILAGAGSGKTKTITYRVAHMVSDLGITPSKILAVSFTNKATKEMQERVKELIGSDLLKKMTLCTFHSLGVKILKKEIHHLGLQNNFNIYTQSDQISLVRQALKHYKAGKSFDQKRILSKISFLKNKGIGNKEFPNSIYMDYEDPYDLAAEFVYHFYQDKLLFYNSIDFDDILFLTVTLFEKYPAIAEKYSNFFSYVMVDEYQDTNPLQFKIIKALTSTHQNICVVGDDDQSIYGFRGAEISNILFFEKNFPNAMVIKLEENYRSSGPILKLANEVIKGNKKRNEKNLWTKKYSDLKPILWAMGDADHEAEIVAEDILKHKNEGGKFSDIAILFRGNNQSSVVEDVLRMNGIPYHYLGGQKFFEKKEVMDLLAYLKVILNPHDEVALRRILNVPNRGIGLTTLTKYLNYAQETKIPLFSALNQFPNQDLTREKNIKSFTHLIKGYQEEFSNSPLHLALKKLVDELNFMDFIGKEYAENPKQMNRRKGDVESFIGSCERFLKFRPDANLKSFIDEMLLKNEDQEEENKGDQVTIMTIHSSKGLEFHTVYLLGVEEEILPHKKSIIGDEDIGEERRLFYVGITRAKERLVMTYCKERVFYGKKIPRSKSRFLIDTKLSTIYDEADRTNFGHLKKEDIEEYKKSFFSNLLSELDRT